MKKYHVAAGDGKGYYGIGYESYREAEGLLKISQSHDPQAHIVEEEYYFTNADRIRAMTDKEMATDLLDMFEEICEDGVPSKEWMMHWLQQPAEGVCDV